MEREIRILMVVMMTLLILALISVYFPRRVEALPPPAAEILDLELVR